MANGVGCVSNGVASHNGKANVTSSRANGAGKDDNKVAVVLGAQWGDEGKGKLVDLLASEVDVVCRCQVRQDEQIYFVFFLSREQIL